MSVATLLGLDESGDGLLEVARVRWPAWQERHAPLRSVDDLDALKEATRRLTPAESNELLLALAELGSPDGGNEAAATAALVWLLLPGAGNLARRLRRALPGLLSGEIDQLVAGQVWIHARTLRASPQRPGWCAATVLRNAERSIRQELGIHPLSDRALRDSMRVGVGSECEAALGRVLDASSPASPAAVELREVMEGAIRAGGICAVEADLLLDVAQHADTIAADVPAGRSASGLATEAVCVEVARRRGCSPRSIRRRTHVALVKLRGATEQSLGRSA